MRIYARPIPDTKNAHMSKVKNDQGVVHVPPEVPLITVIQDMTVVSMCNTCALKWCRVS